MNNLDPYLTHRVGLYKYFYLALSALARYDIRKGMLVGLQLSA